MAYQGYLIDSLNIIRHSLKAIEGGHPEFYRVIALQLRLILCDTTRAHDEIIDISLIRQVNPQVKLHLPGLDNSRMIPLDEWLSSPLPGSGIPTITIRDLIRQVCDKDGGAHVDIRGKSTLPLNCQQWIIQLAENILIDLQDYSK